MDMYKICENLETELKKISDKGLTSSNIDVAYKLIDMYKNVKKLEMMEDSEYSGNDSYGRRRMTNGRYSRAYGDESYGSYRNSYDYDNSNATYNKYLEDKRRYRSNKTMDCKERMMDSLDEYMDSFTKKMEELAEEADCAEERQTIEKYINKIKSVR